MNENGWQKRICDSIKEQGGWARKWGTEFAVGVPDLVCCLPKYGMFVAEVKLLRDCTDTGWNRKTGITPIQLKTVNDINSALGRALVFVVVTYRDGTISPRLYCPFGLNRERLRWDGLTRYVRWEGRFDVNSLLKQSEGVE